MEETIVKKRLFALDETEQNIENKNDIIYYNFTPLSIYELLEKIKLKYKNKFEKSGNFYKIYIKVNKILEFNDMGKLLNPSVIELECKFIVSYILLPFYNKECEIYRFKGYFVDNTNNVYKFQIYKNIFGIYFDKSENLVAEHDKLYLLSIYSFNFEKDTKIFNSIIENIELLN
jgi:hypothetical protein